MEEYIVSARKYRPMSFDSVVGQEALTTTLRNAVRSGKLAHAYLFCGPRGVGKTTCARIFAKAINCECPREDGEACNECESCKAFNEQRSYNIFELDAASNNSVENIKALMEQTRIPPQVGKYKVFIIDEVHMLSTAAFNAFLKTLEEPPAHVVFILATTEKHKILPTILSRCQIYDFERMTVADTVNHLKMVADKEGIHYEDEALAVIAEKADGGMRDALSIFDQVASFCQGDITYAKVTEDLNVPDADNYFRLVDMALENKVSGMMVLLDQLLGKGFDGSLLMQGLAAHVRNVMMAKDEQTLPLLEVSQERRRKYAEQAKNAPTPFLYKALRILNECDVNYRQSSNKRLLVELTLIRVAQITQPADEDVPGAGRSPYRLKILFQKQQPVPRQSVQQVTEVARPSQPAVAEEKVAPREIKPSDMKFGMSFSQILHPDQGGQSTYQAPQAQSVTAHTVAEERQRPFQPEDLRRAWAIICNEIAKDKDRVALAVRMRNMNVAITRYPEVEVVVDNNMLLEQMKAMREELLAGLVERLDNSSVRLNLRHAKPEEVVMPLSKKEVFEAMTKKSPAIERLRATLDLTLT